MRVIKNVESTSIGKTRIKNDDGIYIGENFAGVFDGVSSKCAIMVDGKKVRIADIITEAIKKIDSKTAPSFAKTLDLNEFLQFINMYIKKFCEKHGIMLGEQKLEATGAIYSRYHNQIWLVGDCRAVYDGKTVENDLEADELYTVIRMEVIKSLLEHGYTEEALFENDISRRIIKNPDDIMQYIKDEEEAKRLKTFIQDKMHEALVDVGFTEEEIISGNLLAKYYNPQILQDYAKNNPDANVYGYSVFNGIYTTVKHCKIVYLPRNVRNIRLSTDGFPIDVLKRSKDIGMAIRKNRKLTKQDPLGIKEYRGIHGAVIQDGKNLATDDSSAIDIRIEEDEQIR